MNGSGATQISTWSRKDDLGRKEILEPEQKILRAKLSYLEALCENGEFRQEVIRIPNRKQSRHKS